MASLKIKATTNNVLPSTLPFKELGICNNKLYFGDSNNKPVEVPTMEAWNLKLTVNTEISTENGDGGRVDGNGVFFNLVQGGKVQSSQYIRGMNSAKVWSDTTTENGGIVIETPFYNAALNGGLILDSNNDFSIDKNIVVTIKDSQTITGSKTFKGDNTFSGINQFTGVITVPDVEI